jgi:hypothetical protein
VARSTASTVATAGRSCPVGWFIAPPIRPRSAAQARPAPESVQRVRPLRGPRCGATSPISSRSLHAAAIERHRGAIAPAAQPLLDSHDAIVIVALECGCDVSALERGRHPHVQAIYDRWDDERSLARRSRAFRTCLRGSCIDPLPLRACRLSEKTMVDQCSPRSSPEGRGRPADSDLPKPR